MCKKALTTCLAAILVSISQATWSSQANVVHIFNSEFMLANECELWVHPSVQDSIIIYRCFFPATKSSVTLRFSSAAQCKEEFRTPSTDYYAWEETYREGTASSTNLEWKVQPTKDLAGSHTVRARWSESECVMGLSREPTSLGQALSLWQ